MSDGAGGWSTIESDEGVFTSLIETLGVKNVQFEELVSLDPDTIRSLSPVYGVIFLFKYVSGTGARDSPSPQDGTFDPTATDNGLFFAAQTIQNACGTQAVLSVILNQDSQSQSTDTTTPAIEIGSELSSFKDFTTGFPPDIRGEALSNSAPIRSAHNAFARASPFVDETSRPQPTDPDDSELYHFIAYIPFRGTLYELDGLQPYPISHGECRRGDVDEFPEKLIEVLQRRIGRYPAGEIRFNLMACVRDLRVRAEEFGDVEMMEREKRKRKGWAWENALRRCNFVGFTGEIVKGVVREKCANGGEEGYQKWIEEAKKETARKSEMRRGQTGGE